MKIQKLNKVVLIGPTAPQFKGGIIHYTFNLYQELVKQGYQTKMISFSRAYPALFFPGPQTADLSQKQFLIKQEEKLIDWLNPISWFRTAQQIMKFKPDLVICQWWTWFWALPFFKILLYLKWNSDVKISIIAHNPQDHEQVFYKKWLTNMVLKQADKLIVHNKQLVVSLQHQFPQKKVVLAFHPVYDFFVSKKRVTQLQAQEKLGVSSPLLLFFGHIRYYKGLDILLKALAKANKKIRPKVKLIIAGEFWDKEQDYFKLIKKLALDEQVMIVNHYITNEQVEWYFTATDAVVIPYRQTTGAGPAKIALAFDKPIIATNTGDNTDLFDMAEIGKLVNANSIDELSKAIVDFFSQPLKQYQSELEKVKRELTWARLVEKIIDH